MKLSLIISLVSLIILLMLSGKKGWEKNRSIQRYFMPISILLLVIGLILRLYTGYTSTGFDTDMNAFKTWASMTNDAGFSNMYNQDVFLDYPPGYLYVLALLERIRRILNIDSASNLFTLMIKLPSILGDLLCTSALLCIGRKKLGATRTLVVAAAYLFCPAVIINSALWGQADSFCVAILFAAIWLFHKGKPIPAAALYGLSIICKPQMLVFVPLFLFILFKQKRYWHLLLCPLTAVAVILIVAVPFTNQLNFLWLIEKYWSTMNGYDFYSVNAYNLWALVGKNWASIPAEGAVPYLVNWFGPILATALCGYTVLRSDKKSVLFICPVILMATTYIFTVKMHERYLFPALLFILVTYLFEKDHRLLYAFGFVSLTHCMNVAYVLHLNLAFGNNYDPNEFIVKLISALQIASYLYLMWVIHSVFIENKRCLPSPAKTGILPVIFHEDNHKNRFTMMDLASVCTVTLLYAAFAFAGLGSTETAVTSWTPNEGDAVVLRLNDNVSGITYIPGIAPDTDHYNARVGTNVQIALSDDGEHWLQAEQLPEAGVFCWTTHNLSAPAKYVQLTAMDDEVCLNEIAFHSQLYDGSEVPQLISGEGQRLIDEQKVVPLYPSSYNSTYFDEIYHARTAYEHILKLEPYEYTHPPLGKLIISLGIRLFGMNPFGWRFFGTLAGVLMLPIFYHLLKQLFSKPLLCTAGTILFAFDFMHFTQTRIATIDTYAVFFILLMYDAMIVFMKQDLTHTPLYQQLLPLAFSGVFMGLGIASKWTVVYGALGLAVLFFAKLFTAWNHSKKTEECISQVNQRMKHLCLWCILLFILIPFAIYFAAFLPITTLTHNTVFLSFIRYQTAMFSYHSNLVATHDFASPWYEWPFSVRPIWYAYTSTPNANAAQVSTISAMGSPALWWPAVAAVCYTFYDTVRKKTFRGFICLCGLISVYLPWVFISRITFIYHYFTAVPFIIIAVVYAFDRFYTMYAPVNPPLSGKSLRLSLPTAALLLFVFINLIFFGIFYPVLSGFPANSDYIEALEWLPRWYFG